MTTCFLEMSTAATSLHGPLNLADILTNGFTIGVGRKTLRPIAFLREYGIMSSSTTNIEESFYGS